MTKRYLHIAFGIVDTQRLNALEAVFNTMSGDWMRYNNTCWVTWTLHAPSIWFNAIQPHLKAGEHLLILELKPNQEPLQGMLPQWAWNWLNTTR